MTRINLTPFILIAFATALGALLGSWLLGLVIGLGVVLLASVLTIAALKK